MRIKAIRAILDNWPFALSKVKMLFSFLALVELSEFPLIKIIRPTMIGYQQCSVIPQRCLAHFQAERLGIAQLTYSVAIS